MPCDLQKELLERFDLLHTDGLDVSEEVRYNAMQTTNMEDARNDLIGVIRQLRRAPKRRATPAWSLPSELWLLII